jgi:uncharacterized protein (DUF58 family)
VNWDSPSVVRPTLRTWVCYGLAGLLLLVAVADHTPVPLFAAVPLLIAPLAALLLSPAGREPLTLQWQEAGEGQEVVVSGELIPPPSIDARDVDVEIGVPPGLIVTKPLAVRPSGGAVTFTMNLRAREPVLAQLARPTVRWRDGLGLMERPLPIDGMPLPIERCPLEAGRLGTVRLHRTIVLPGETRSRAIGENGDFYGVRISLPGDSPRRINWSASARSEETFTNEFSLERTGDVLIFLDARPTELGPWMDARLLGVARAAAFGMADAFLRERARVGLAIFGEFLTPVKLGGGRRQRYRIREALLGAEVAAVAGPSERAGFAARRFFPAGITTIVVSSLADESTRHLVLHLRRRGYPSVVLSPSPVPVADLDRWTTGEERRLALRLVELVRRHQIAEVWSEAPVVDWRDYWSLAGFSAFLKQGMRNRRTG